jgi:hypothetical protein
MTEPSSKKTSPLLVAAAWVIIAIPLGWGLYQSVVKSKPLFSAAKAPAAQAAPAKGPGN